MSDPKSLLEQLAGRLSGPEAATLCDPRHTAAIKALLGQISRGEIPQFMTLGGRRFEILSYTKPTTSSPSNTSWFWGYAKDLGVTFGQDVLKHILQHQHDIPGACYSVRFAIPGVITPEWGGQMRVAEFKYERWTTLNWHFPSDVLQNPNVRFLRPT